MKFYKYQGSGNDFIVIDGRDGKADSLSAEKVQALCQRRYGIGSDGVMVLRNSDKYSFAMDFYNPDGSSGMMCGNGGRCIVAFAASLGIEDYHFIAADGPHDAEILERGDRCMTIRLKMKDVTSVNILTPTEYFLDTGTRHFVRFVKGLKTYDVAWQGALARHDSRFAPIGANANFVQPTKNKGEICVRTFEKGVEAETFSCGTGIVASAIAAYIHGVEPQSFVDGRVRYEVQALKDRLAVDFIPDIVSGYRDIHLTGPATLVAEISDFYAPGF